MNKAVIYTRVSTNDQCVSNQLKVLREIAEKKGLEVVREISDGTVNAVKHMRENNVPIKRIAKDLHIGVGTVYKVLEQVKVA